MKRAYLALIVLVLVFNFTAQGNAQVITGGGTTNTIPQFTGPTTIGDSPIVQSNGNVAIGDVTQNNVRLEVSAPAGDFQPYAIVATINSEAGFSAGIRGDASGSAAIGVIGLTYNNSVGVTGVALGSEGSGNGVEGTVESTTGGGGNGVYGHTSATSGFSTGVRGEAYANTGGAVAVFGIVHSPDAQAGQFINDAGGSILAGVGANGAQVFRVNGKGTVFADGGFRPRGADFAESMAVKGDRSRYEAGDLLMIDSTGERRLALSHTRYSPLVAGIYSTKPGVVASQHTAEDSALDNEVPLAVVGIVPCKVSAENGAIYVGDLLVASSTPGYAMKGTDRSKMLGAVVGKALEPLREGKGLVQVLVTLQ